MKEQQEHTAAVPGQHVCSVQTLMFPYLCSLKDASFCAASTPPPPCHMFGCSFFFFGCRFLCVQVYPYVRVMLPQAPHLDAASRTVGGLAWHA